MKIYQEINSSNQTLNFQSKNIDFETEFPLVVKIEGFQLNDFFDFIEINCSTIEELTLSHGAVLLRGLPLTTPDDFDSAIQRFYWENFTYEDSLSNAVRVVHSPRVFSANEAPPETTIFLHHEMAQTPLFPSKLFFFCQKAANKGGSTPICRSDHLWELIQEELPAFSVNCRERGLKYTNVMPAEEDLKSGMGRTWQSTLSVDSPKEAEFRLNELGYTWEWLNGNELKVTTPVLPAIRELSDGRYSFFNQLIAAFKGWKDARNDPSKSITFGDGSIINPYDISKISDLADAITFDLQWEDGDLAIIDNFLCMHGRRSYTGTRKVLASLVA
jgi:alpha-ketoglutarate-dependent taurine dioxygenase